MAESDGDLVCLMCGWRDSSSSPGIDYELLHLMGYREIGQLPREFSIEYQEGI